MLCHVADRFVMFSIDIDKRYCRRGFQWIERRERWDWIVWLSRRIRILFLRFKFDVQHCRCRFFELNDFDRKSPISYSIHLGFIVKNDRKEMPRELSQTKTQCITLFLSQRIDERISIFVKKAFQASINRIKIQMVRFLKLHILVLFGSKMCVEKSQRDQGRGLKVSVSDLDVSIRLDRLRNNEEKLYGKT